jgi:outer membrane protein assembly factor BamB
MTKFVSFLVMVSLLCVVGGFGAVADDWPTFRRDNTRGAATTEGLSWPLTKAWTFTPPHAPEPAWPVPGKEKARVRFDECYHVAVAEGAAYFGSSADGKLYALDAKSGALRWSVFTDGPIRVAPTVAAGKVYVGSDDGHAYCFNAADGALAWKRQAGFRDDKLLGNGKMISRWPVRTGVMVADGVAYFGAGVFPHETVFLYAVDAASGEILWRNDTFGQRGYKLDFGGMTPQGPLLLSDTTLFMSSGRAMPAAFSREDGRFLNYLNPGGKVGGTWAIIAEDRLIAGIESKKAYDTKGGAPKRLSAYAWFPGWHLVVSGTRAFLSDADTLTALDRDAFANAEKRRGELEKEIKPLSDKRRGLERKLPKASEEGRDSIRTAINALNQQIAPLQAEIGKLTQSVRRWSRPSELRHALALAKDTLVLGGEGVVAAAQTETGEEIWRARIAGGACGLAVADGQLFVSSDNGEITAFAPQGSGGNVQLAMTAGWPKGSHNAFLSDTAEAILKEAKLERGYALILGLETGQLAYEIARRSEMKIVCREADAAKAAAARKTLDGLGLYGARVSVDHGGLEKPPYANYFADLIVSETELLGGDIPTAISEVERMLKPCGGVGALREDNLPSFVASQTVTELPHLDQHVAIALTEPREALEGAGSWTHQYADPGNTATAQDERIQGAMEVLWFGEPGPEKMVERHARSVAPVSMDGRLFVQGEDIILAYDAYNGTKLWEREIEGAVRVRVDSDMGNLALSKTGLYVAAQDKCHRLDPATGAVLRVYALPGESDAPRRWGYIAEMDGVLYGTAAKPLKQDYGDFWKEAVDEEGAWRDLDKDGMNSRAKGYLADYFNRHKTPDKGAFWDAQRAGMLWRNMESWPAWGSVETPQGAVTERIMAGQSLFAFDAESGDLLWQRDGKAIAHPAIALGDGLLFYADCDAVEAEKKAAMAARARLIEEGVWEAEGISYGPEDTDIRRLIALDARTGETRWERVVDLTGCGGDRMGMAYNQGVLCFFGCFSNHDRQFFKEGKLAWRRITAMDGKTGSDKWSRPLNYLRRPVIVNDEILIEPRICDLFTGEVKKRMHPLTGNESEFEYVRPGHCCSATSAAPNMFFLRGYFLWYYDLQKDQGMLPFGAIRPGCWINTIPANGLLLFPEASAGCTCSYPIRSTVVMQPSAAPQRTWSIAVQNGALTPVKNLAVNFGAPGDWRDDNGTLWLGYPHPPSTGWHTYGLGFKLGEKFHDGRQWYHRNFQHPDFAADPNAWRIASGAAGFASCRLPLREEGQGSAPYTVRLYFAEPGDAAPGERIFDIQIQGQKLTLGVDIAKEAGGPNKTLVKEFKGISVDTDLLVELVPSANSKNLPVLNGLEAILEGS